MKFTVVAVGKLKERFWAEACNEYIKRLGPYAKTNVVEVPDADPARVGGVKGALDQEGEQILQVISRVGEHTRVILLAIDGQQRTSEDLSHHIDNLGLNGMSELVFVIGGSHGVNADVVTRADETLSFGAITLPHNLARVVLLEQLYRACKISRGEPYHK